LDGTKVIAYFSMEIALQAEIPTYSGGLGVLAGDTIRAAADLTVPMIGVTLAHRKGYFHQTLNATAGRRKPEEWSLERFVSRCQSAPMSPSTRDPSNCAAGATK
jgi:starch phosphorylase